MNAVIKSGKIVAASKNLRVLTRYASDHSTYVDKLYAARNEDGSGELTVYYADGAHADASFVSFTVMLEWIKARLSWRGATITTHLDGTKNTYEL